MFSSTATPLLGARSSREVRQLNEQFVLTCLRQEGPLTRQELATRLEVTPMAIGRIVSGLLDRDIVKETRIKQKAISMAEAAAAGENAGDPSAADGRGRPRTLVRLNPDWVGLGIDFRVHKTEAVLVDVTGKRLASERIDLSPEQVGDPNLFVSAVEETVAKVRAENSVKLAGVGVGMAGLLDPERRTTLRSHYLGWNAYPLVDKLEQRLQLPVGMRHIAECAALGNAIQPETSDSNCLLHIQVGVGLGIAVIRNQDLAVTRPIGEGEPGHAPLFESDKKCICGRYGCADTVIGFDAFAEAARVAGLTVSRTEMEQTAHEVMVHACKGEAWATSAMDRLQQQLARIVAIFTAIEAADCVTVGGYTLALGSDFMDEVSQSVSHILQVPSPMVALALGDDAPGYGAAMLGLSQIVRS